MSDYEDIMALVKAMGERITEYHGQITAELEELEDRVTDAESGVESVRHDLNSVEDTVRQLDSSVDDVKSRVEDLVFDTEALRSDVDSLEDKAGS